MTLVAINHIVITVSSFEQQGCIQVVIESCTSQYSYSCCGRSRVMCAINEIDIMANCR